MLSTAEPFLQPLIYYIYNIYHIFPIFILFVVSTLIIFLEICLIIVTYQSFQMINHQTSWKLSLLVISNLSVLLKKYFMYMNVMLHVCIVDNPLEFSWYFKYQNLTNIIITNDSLLFIVSLFLFWDWLGICYVN